MENIEKYFGLKVIIETSLSNFRLEVLSDRIGRLAHKEGFDISKFDVFYHHITVLDSDSSETPEFCKLIPIKERLQCVDLVFMVNKKQTKHGSIKFFNFAVNNNSKNVGTEIFTAEDQIRRQFRPEEIIGNNIETELITLIDKKYVMDRHKKITLYIQPQPSMSFSKILNTEHHFKHTLVSLPIIRSIKLNLVSDFTNEQPQIKLDDKLNIAEMENKIKNDNKMIDFLNNAWNTILGWTPKFIKPVFGVIFVCLIIFAFYSIFISKAQNVENQLVPTSATGSENKSLNNIKLDTIPDKVYVSGKIIINNGRASCIERLTLQNIDVNSVKPDLTGKYTFKDVDIPQNKKLLVLATFTNGVTLPTEELKIGNFDKETNTVLLDDLLATCPIPSKSGKAAVPAQIQLNLVVNGGTIEARQN